MSLPLPKLVGIINITPDSFSGGREVHANNRVLSDIKVLINDGADIIDIGAESTRPGATPLSQQEEWQRLEPVISDIITLCHHHNVQVSVDSYHPNTISQAISLGIDMINDVSGGDNPQMLEVMQSCQLPVVIMHHLGIPVDKTVTLPQGCDPIAEILAWAQQKLSMLEAAGINKDRIILDPGIGFGKTAEQSLTLLKRSHELAALSLPLYIGHSRKSFLSLITDTPPAERDTETLAASLMLARQGAAFLRVHNVAIHSRAFAVAAAFDA